MTRYLLAAILGYVAGAISMYAGMVILAVLRPEERPLEEAALFV